MRKNHHKESDLQIRFVKWVRVNYPEYAMLFEHPKNEGSGCSPQDRMRQAIAKAEGVQAGVADLIFHVPSVSNYYNREDQEEPYTYHSLAFELKTRTGRQSREQKLFQRYFEAAGGRYIIGRDFDTLTAEFERYMAGVPSHIDVAIRETYEAIQREATEAARDELNRIINK